MVEQVRGFREDEAWGDEKFPRTVEELGYDTWDDSCLVKFSEFYFFNSGFRD